jgi:hypothetical protein
MTKLHQNPISTATSVHAYSSTRHTSEDYSTSQDTGTAVWRLQHQPRHLAQQSVPLISRNATAVAVSLISRNATAVAVSLISRNATAVAVSFL